MTKPKRIIFNEHEVRATLSGQKSQFRRVVSVQPTNNNTLPLFDSYGIEWSGESASGAIRYPYGKKGDCLWVKETWATLYHPIAPKIVYRSDYQPLADVSIKWKSSVHMPREASRITLEITEVKVKRLWDIDLNDCVEEGIELLCPALDYPNVELFRYFRSYWDSANKKHPWNSNPWVWVYDFKLIEKGDKCLP